VILRQAGQPREEIDLVDPTGPAKQEEETAAEVLPRAICPDGSPASLWQDSASGEMLPGCSPVDSLVHPMESAASESSQAETSNDGNPFHQTPLPPGGDL
jgi:hypothetical protein